MTNPTRQEIIRAYGTLSFLWDCLEVGWKLGASTIESSKSTIEKVLPPLPQPTMAEVEWDNCKHHFAEAIHPNLGQVIMLSKNVDTGDIFCDFYTYGEQYFAQLNPKNLTPTGKRYTLTEVQE
ncbi:hypothetical protein [uncultured Corynebacterium sp.]|uniref:hypothetical protein n=1 Tax=uncultured Corynebacterium sp. TaxID=159447 RepID=UPI002057D5DA|nr:hypothetical protein [uncultured Corynebacterium sp.]DAU17419.1 MAG TPA: hypothetical protein [Caudoviricetes sp.]